MVFVNKETYANVWKITPAENGKYIDLQITTSEKDQEGEWHNSSWFPRCIGKSVNTLKNLKERDRIVITKCKFTNERYKDKEGNWKNNFRFIILEANIENSSESSSGTTQKASPAASKQEDDDCPW